MSYAIICGAEEPMEWYSNHYFKHLQKWHDFAKEYAYFNWGTEPGGINPYLSPELNYNLPSKEAIFQVLCKAAQAFPGATRYECRVDEECGAQRVFEAQGTYRPEALPAPDLKLVQDDGASGWWFVLRPSGNEPKLRLNVEAWGNNASTDCQKMVKDVDALILQAGGVRA